MNDLLAEIKGCTICKEHLALGPRPVLSAHEKSKVLIEMGELSISAIAYDTGFSTPGNFSTAFKKFYGDTPAQYRSKHFKSSSK